MNIPKILEKIRPGAAWSMVGYDDYAKLEWHDTIQTKPTLVEIQAAAPEVTEAQAREVLSRAIQNHLDTKANERGYDSILSACSYAGSPNPYQSEGVAFLTWRGGCWNKCYAILTAAQQGQKYNPAWADVIPTEAELLAELPELVL